MIRTNHINEDLLYAYSEETLGKNERESVEFHLNDCPSCREKLQEFRSLRSALVLPRLSPSYEPLFRAIRTASAANIKLPLQGGRPHLRTKALSTPNVPAFTRGKTPIRGAILQFAVPLALAITLGSGAGLWVTRLQSALTPAQTIQLYIEAEKAYDDFKPEQGLALFHKALGGTLVLPGASYSPEDKYRLTLLQLIDNNSRYARVLAGSGHLNDALKIADMTEQFGDQLLNQKDYRGGFAANMYTESYIIRKKAYLAAHDVQRAQEVVQRLRQKQAERTKSYGKLSHELICNRGLYLTWPKGDRKVAQIEAELKSRIRAVWRNG